MTQSAVEQVGGTHYGRADSYGHWDFVWDANIQYYEACATKYVQRWKLKAGVVDLRKAVSYVEKLLSKLPTPFERELPEGETLALIESNLSQFYTQQNVGVEEQKIMSLIFLWEKRGDLELAIHLINKLLEEAKAEAWLLSQGQAEQGDADGNYTDQG